MSTFSDSPGPVEPLTSLNKDGKPYERSPAVQAELSRILSLHQFDWIAEVGDFRNETLVYLIRKNRCGDPELYGRLFQELSTRITRIVRRNAWGLDRFSAQDIILKVEIQIIELVLAEKPSRKTDFLEVGFAEVVERRTLDAVRRHETRPQGKRGEIFPGATDEDGDEIERPIELAADDRPGPEAILLERQDAALRKKLIRKARDAVKDPRHFEAVMLHKGEGLPITSKDPTKPDLERHFQERPRKIKHRLAAAMKAMRKALGVKK